MNWRNFIRTSGFAILFIGVAFYAFIILVNPYQNIKYSLPLDREPISTNQRFAYPALARSDQFNSAIIGSSTARLLDPGQLDNKTDGRFVNLAMNSATAYEQSQILKLFLRHHTQPKYILIGIDDAWCRRGDKLQKFTFRAFPEWMYDDNTYNDLLYMFNDKALENSVRMVEYWLGSRQAKYNRRGYSDFTQGFGDYDPVQVASRLYPNGAIEQALEHNELAPAATLNDWRFPSHALLDELISTIPKQTRLVLLMVPFHANYLQRSESLYRQCKRRVFDLLEERPAIVVDYMKINSLTAADENYWDPLHFTRRVAIKLEHDIAAVLDN